MSTIEGSTMARKTLSILACGVLAAGTMLVGAGIAAAASPIGHLDGVRYDVKYNTIDVYGWAGDADAGTAAIRIHVYIDGSGAQAVSTGLDRPDVAAAHPNLGTHTGFYADPAQPPGRGQHNVCVYAINVASGANLSLGCRSVQVTWPTALTGHIDHIGVDPGDPSQRIATGWALDPKDAVSPTQFVLVRTSGPSSDNGFSYLEGSAGSSRPDVDHAYPHNGHNHGFSMRFSATDVDWLATDRICLAQDRWVPGWTGPVTTACFTYAG